MYFALFNNFSCLLYFELKTEMNIKHFIKIAFSFLLFIIRKLRQTSIHLKKKKNSTKLLEFCLIT